ncbi:hypothetical protein BGX28_009495, partial [Mortierella sp. GBA30]
AVPSQQDGMQYGTVPANCSYPTAPPRKSSLETPAMAPPKSTGLAKSATLNSFYSTNTNDYALTDASRPGTPCCSELGSPNQRTLQRRRSSISSVSKRESFSLPNNVLCNNAGSSINGTPSQRLAIDANVLSIHAKDGSYLPTPTESSYCDSLHDGLSQYADIGPPFLPSTPADVYATSEVHPLESATTAAVTDTRNMGDISGLSMSTASATIQYLQQLQQSMMGQDIYPFSYSQNLESRQLIEKQPAQKQQKAPQTVQTSQSRRGSKAKPKRRMGLLASIGQAYPSSDISWAMMAVQQAAPRPSVQPPPLSCAEPLSTCNVQSASTSTSRSFYHGPAPCGNPEPLYEYLASPTVVPGLEIIGHDYYGNFVQILPICPETTCSMNQDPVYLNLLQAIYAHTIPFLDLAPGSDEETQRLMNSTSSAIATQSIQPPFKNLLPLTSGPMGHGKGTGTTGILAKNENRTTLSSSVSSPSFQQAPSKMAGLPRRSSLSSISSVTTPNSRRSSTTSSVSSTNNNPARKKKNTPRTHPYKSTSTFKDDNPVVTEAILTQVGGLGGIGNSATISATDPRHKVAEKMVHMDEAEYAAHYSKHQRSMNKSASSTALCLAQALTTSMAGSSLGPLPTSALMSSSVSAPSIMHATGSRSGSVGQNTSSLDSIAAADFIRALSECNGGATGLAPKGNGQTPMPLGPASAAVATTTSQERDLMSLEKLMLIDSNAAAAVQAAAATAWPNWFDLRQLERDVCEMGMNNQASAFTSASCSMTNMPLSNSTTLASFVNPSKENASTNLLLSSSTDLALMDDLIEGRIQANINSTSSSSPTCQDSKMTLAVPTSSGDNRNSTSQVLVFDEYTTEHLSLDSPASSSASSSSASSLSSAGTSATASIGKTCPSDIELKAPVTNDLTLPYMSTLLTVLPFSVEHSHPIFPTRGNRRSGWYRSKSVASQGLSQITGVDYTTTCWYDVERLQSVVRDSISFHESSTLKSLEDLTEPDPTEETS